MKSVNIEKPRPLNLRTLVATGVLALAASLTLAFSNPATLVIDGRRIQSDVPPVTQNRQAYVPLRAVLTGLGASTTYDKQSRTVEVVHGPDHLKLHIGERNATLNGRPVRLSHAPFTVRGRTMVATRTIERALGPKVHYDPHKATIDVFTTEGSAAVDSGDGTSSEAF
jgi:N-acetylmuramoyl-L-alanine amidase